ncbi:hypothetical protein [Paracoccus aestuariivivens]|uniref:Uncharacterized protein n=1 Tax=Paracoccus aestuariivivens TaxID=1820333 RepID=A0A6L6JH23_9RHOB|nr:hypothetical protein [Paracoccus aestuariivivens]MTH79857.1 hypothetical protein [Paracoccus aestuariivivens]
MDLSLSVKDALHRKIIGEAHQNPIKPHRPTAAIRLHAIAIDHTCQQMGQTLSMLFIPMRGADSDKVRKASTRWHIPDLPSRLKPASAKVMTQRSSLVRVDRSGYRRALRASIPASKRSNTGLLAGTRLLDESVNDPFRDDFQCLAPAADAHEIKKQVNTGT